MSTWTELAAIDVNEHTERKGKFTYLAWTFAWSSVVEKYPDAVYRLLDDMVFADGSMEVRTEVTIEGKTLPMWLCVTDFNNKAIERPNSFDINTARMRCLTKNLAMHGLGFYIYAGESAPAPSAEMQEKYEELLSYVANKEHFKLRQFTEVNKPAMDNIFNMAPDGHKTKFKNDVRAVYQQSANDIKANLAAIEELIGEDAPEDQVHEAWSEIVGLEREYTIRALNEVLRKQLEEKIGELE